MDFAIGVVNSVLNLPKGQVKFFGEFKIQMSKSMFTRIWGGGGGCS